MADTIKLPNTPEIGAALQKLPKFPGLAPGGEIDKRLLFIFLKRIAELCRYDIRFDPKPGDAVFGDQEAMDVLSAWGTFRPQENAARVLDRILKKRAQDLQTPWVTEAELCKVLKRDLKLEKTPRCIRTRLQTWRKSLPKTVLDEVFQERPSGKKVVFLYRKDALKNLKSWREFTSSLCDM